MTAGEYRFWTRVVRIYWGCWKVNKAADKILKGIGAGMAAGVAVGLVSTMMKSSGGRQMKRTGRKAIHAVENVLDQALYMLK